MSSPKLFLLDAMALIYRAHFAFVKNPRITSQGVNTSAIFGFMTTMLEVIEKEKPTHLGVSFDLEGPTFRHDSFEAYKAHRQEQPEDITFAIPKVKELLRAMRVPILEVQGFEADDVIGTLAKKAEAAGYEIFMMTPDKDYCQLVSERIKVYKPAFMGKGPEKLGVAEVLEKWEIQEISQVIDILGLMGDAVDNIPGIPGIGEKTAKKFIAQYGTVENLLDHAHEIKGKMGETLVQFRAQGLQSKELATIHLDVPIAFDGEDLALCPPDKDALKPLLAELEFRSLSKRILGEEDAVSTVAPKSRAKASPAGQTDLFAPATPETAASSPVSTEGVEAADTPSFKTWESENAKYEIINQPEEAHRLAQWLCTQEAVCFDTETDGLDAMTAQLVGMSFSWGKGIGYYLPAPYDFDDCKEWLAPFKAFFEHQTLVKIGQNIKYDMGVLVKYGIQVQGPLFDTMLAHYLLEPDQRHGMDTLAMHYLNYQPISITSLIGKKGKEQGTMRDVSLPLIGRYAAEDADVTWQLYEVFKPMIQEKGLESLLMETEGPLISVLNAMEQEGITLDNVALKQYSGLLADEVARLEETIYGEAGEVFNIASPKQLGVVLFEKLKLDPKAKKTATGQYATGEEVLVKLAGEHALPKLILDYRELQKLKSTYVDALPMLISPVTGRIHTSYNQAVAATGRLSSTNPNLQNIPIRTERGREIRKAFVARGPEYQILSADYSQIELRIMAAFSEDPTMLLAFQEGKDIHAITASKLYKIPLEEVNSDMRRKAKTANFGIIYGISAFGLSQRLDIPRREAADIINNYFLEFPRIKAYMDQVINQAREQGYVQTLLGRRRYLADINSGNLTMRGFAERNAINAPIQGSAADMIKIAMIRIYQWMQTEKLRSKLVLQVHDELVFDAHVEEIDYMKPHIERLMKEALPLPVPMEVGIGVGKDWLSAH